MLKIITLLIGLLLTPSVLLAQFGLTKDINTGAGSCTPVGLNQINSRQVIFSCYDVGNRAKLWISDGTSDGTSNFYDTAPEASFNYLVESKTLSNNQLTFRQQTTVNTSEYEQFWITDGTESGTTKLSEMIGFINQYIVLSDRIFIIFSDTYYQGLDEGLYEISEEGSQHLLFDIEGVLGISGTKLILKKSHNLTTIFDLETQKTSDVSLPGSGAFSQYFVVNNHLVYMSEGEGLNSVNLATLSHNLLLDNDDIAPGVSSRSFSTSPNYAIGEKGYFYLIHSNWDTGSEVIPSSTSFIETDGVSAEVIKKSGGPNNTKYTSSSTLVAMHGNSLYFSIPNSENQEELWRLNPTINEATFFINISASDTYGVSDLLSANGLLYFKYQKTDNSEDTPIIYSLNTESNELQILTQGLDSISSMKKTSNGIFISASTPELGSELYYHPFSSSDDNGTDDGGTGDGGTDDGETDDGETDDGETDDGGTDDGGADDAGADESLKDESSGGGSISFLIIALLLLMLRYRANLLNYHD